MLAKKKQRKNKCEVDIQIRYRGGNTAKDMPLFCKKMKAYAKPKTLIL